LTRHRLLEGSAAAATALGFSGLLAACEDDESAQTGTPAATGKPKRGGRLRSGHNGGGTQETLDPYTPTSGFAQVEVARYRALYDQLVRYARDAGAIEWMVAEPAQPNADHTLWQLRLKPDITFHDGKPLTADDVLFSWARVLDPKTGNAGSSTFGTTIDMKRTKKVSDRELSVVLKRPLADFGQTLVSSGPTWILPRGFDPKRPIGSGPFKFVSASPGQRSLVEKNVDYWRGEPYLDEIEHISIPDSKARLNALLGGQVDAIDQIDAPLAKANENNDAIRIMRTKSDASVPFYMYLATKPFADPRVREAFKLAIDRPKTVDVAHLGFGRVGNDLFGPDHPFYNDQLPQREYDPEKARSLLKQAGYDRVSVELPSSNVNAGMFESATAYAQQAKAAGIDIKVRKIPAEDQWNTDKYYLKSPFYQSYWGSFLDYVGQSALVPGGATPETGWAELYPEWGRDFKRAQATLDKDEAKEIWFRLQEQLWDHGGYVVWGYSDIVDGLSPKVRGIEPWRNFSLGGFVWDRVWLDA
jgi:peptide/nickel transport system substrate-binding protein